MVQRQALHVRGGVEVPDGCQCSGSIHGVDQYDPMSFQRCTILLLRMLLLIQPSYALLMHTFGCVKKDTAFWIWSSLSGLLGAIGCSTGVDVICMFTFVQNTHQLECMQVRAFGMWKPPSGMSNVKSYIVLHASAVQVHALWAIAFWAHGKHLQMSSSTDACYMCMRVGAGDGEHA